MQLHTITLNDKSQSSSTFLLLVIFYISQQEDHTEEEIVGEIEDDSEVSLRGVLVLLKLQVNSQKLGV